ncbi:hypothetical protein NFI96_012609, partial [Prochilodus magdalenae]
RAPLVTQPESARQPRPHTHGSAEKCGMISARHVGVTEFDQRFADLVETFNGQYEHYEVMEEKRKTLMYRYRCSTDAGLSECLQKIKDEHDKHHVRLEMKGYDFTLVVTPEDGVPDKLKRTKENISELCQAAKSVVAVSTKLQEMINWFLKAEESLTRQVNEAAATHQDRKRLGGNLKENLKEARRAKELSPRYREEAGKLLNEAALLSGVTP